VLLREIEEAAAIISGTVDPDAEIIYGHIVDDQLADTIRITVIATGFQRIRPMPSYEQLRIKSAVQGEGKYEIPAFLRM
jgi:cell division protein FtsZ